MKQRVKLEDGIELPTICRQLKLVASDGKKYLTDCANTQSLLRIIQSIPSPKAEPFKQWLAKVGYERIKETIDPAQSIDRARENWQKLGRSKNRQICCYRRKLSTTCSTKKEIEIDVTV